jgi:hypothetical protein
MPAIATAKEIAAKWSRVTQGRSADFAAGVKAPKKSWEKGATAAAESYKSGVIEAANAGRFEKGVKAAGDSKWQDKTTKIGVGRWSGGVAVAQPDFEAGFARFVDVIAKTELPMRYPKGDPRNYERVKVLGEALRAAKNA